MKNLQLLDDIITGRAEPHIYAFTTKTVPDYLKVGDTHRPVGARLNEWKVHFPDLVKEYECKASIPPDIFFRDFSIHEYLESALGKHRLQPHEISSDIYYSKEFFKDTTVSDIEKAIDDIRNSHENNENRYQFYDSQTSLPKTHTYRSTGIWNPRPNQAAAIRNFMAAVGNGRNHLLMYAVMRFGKSFTSLCCAKEMKAKIVLVVSAKADVREEWKKTVQSAENFCNNYTFLSSDELSSGSDVIKNELNKNKGVLIFLTLQDLQGDSMKEKHAEVFSNQIDLLIVDETHYGARAESYGKPLRDSSYERDIHVKKLEDDFIETEDAKEQLKSLNVKVTLHLSGTPYRILMGTEFSREDIITFCQFTDIANEQKKWDMENDGRSECEQEEEWKNPYFGFPQMVRFAFHPSKSALALLENLKSSGTTYAFSALLKPQSLTLKKDGSHKKFRYENEVLELFEAIDGSKEEENVLAFLDYDKIKEGNMCRHIVCVLPYCASCDALEALLTANAASFKNLAQYKIINISGVEAGKTYKTVASVKREIINCEKADIKTLTLTVNRMLTGSTVEQWDTMIFLKDTASPQEYDQAIFRLQNQYIVKYKNDEGEEISYNMKPQTLLVDFDPHRMFAMQEQKSLIYNVNTDSAGNRRLKERMEEELNISPIITLNKNKIEQVDAADILARLSEYSNSRGVRDEAQDIPVDSSLFHIEEIVEEIERQAEIGSKGGLQMDAYTGKEGSELDAPDDEQEEPPGGGFPPAEADESGSDSSSAYNKEMQALENKFRTYYSRLLFFAFLTENTVSSVDGILAANSADDARIMKNLQLDGAALAIIRRHINPFILSRLDYKIQNINSLAHDESVPSIERALTAMNKFGKLSESEVSTPIHVAENMVALLPDDCFEKIDGGHKILDIASKAGEFAVAICKRCKHMRIPAEAIRDAVLSIPTSSVAYEFTRKMYKILGLNTESIASGFYSYGLLDIKDDGGNIDYGKIKLLLSQKKDFCDISLTDDVKEEGGFMKFNAVVGNPPYQESDGGAQASARPIYPDFVNLSRRLMPDFVSIIMPARWYTGGKGGKDMDAFRLSMLDDKHIKELHDCLHPEIIFPDTNNRGGICYFLWDKQYDNSKFKTKVVTHKGKSEMETAIRFLRTDGFDVFFRSLEAINIIHKVIVSGVTDVMSDHVSPRKPFGIESNIVKKPQWHVSESGLCAPLKCVGKGKQYGFVEYDIVKSHKELIDVWKVFTPRANNIGTELNDDNLNTLIGEPKTICTEAYLVIGGDLHLDLNRAENLSNYFKTKFARFMHGLAKASHDATSKTYRFVPTQDFSEEWTDKKLYQKYALTPEEIDYIENSIKPMD